MKPVPACIAAGLMTLTAACGSSSGGSRADQPATTAATPSACAHSAHGDTFPAGLPARVPHPSFATSPEYLEVTIPGEKALRFSTEMSLRAAAAFVAKRYPAAGYELQNGDSEFYEADLPFTRGKIHGKTKLASTARCTTVWTVVTIRGEAGDLSMEDSEEQDKQ